MNNNAIGYIGLGTMGLPMAANMAKASYSMVVADISPDKLAQIAALANVRVANSPREVAEQCRIVCACLPNPQAGNIVFLGANGVIEGAHDGLIVCDNSTIDAGSAVKLHRALGAKGVGYIECPVLGGRQQADSGELFAIVSGDSADYERVKPLIEIISRDHRFVGGTGAASRMKTVQNGLGLVQWAGMVEALGILAKAGIDLELWYEVVSNGHGMADTRLFRTFAKKIIEDDRTFQAFLNIGAKDIGLACQQAQEMGVDPSVFKAARSLFAEAMETGLGDQDMAQIARVIEKRFGVKLTQ